MPQYATHLMNIRSNISIYITELIISNDTPLASSYYVNFTLVNLEITITYTPHNNVNDANRGN